MRFVSIMYCGSGSGILSPKDYDRASLFWEAMGREETFKWNTAAGGRLSLSA